MTQAVFHVCFYYVCGWFLVGTGITRFYFVQVNNAYVNLFISWLPKNSQLLFLTWYHYVHFLWLICIAKPF